MAALTIDQLLEWAKERKLYWVYHQEEQQYAEDTKRLPEVSDMIMEALRKEKVSPGPGRDAPLGLGLTQK